MKKLIFLLISALLILSLVGCSKTYSSTDELIEKVREEIPVADADTIEIVYAGMCGVDDTALIWYVSGNEYQSHTYFPVECNIIGKAEYEYVQSFNPMERGTDIAVLQWKDGYAFCINNPNCKIIRITDETGTHDKVIEKDTYPYVFYNEFPVSEYIFLDTDGNEIN